MTDALPGVSVCMVTARREPGFAAMVDAILEAERYDGHQPWELIVVDEALWFPGTDIPRRDELASIIRGRFRFQHVAPKPTVWRGPWRLTQNDHWDKQSALNTAVCYARHKRVAFFDDQSVVGRAWLSLHRASGAPDAVSICAPYRYWHPGVTIDHARPQQVHGRPHEPGDNRLHTTDENLTPCDPSWIYGGNCSFPLDAVLRCNGWEELLSGSGGLEDSEFSVRVSRVTTPVWRPNREATVHYLTELPQEVIGGYIGKANADVHGTPQGEEPTKCKGFWYVDDTGLRHWYTWNHIPVWRLNAHRAVPRGDTVAPVYDDALEPERRRFTAIGNRFVLRDMRACIQSGGVFPIPTEPTVDWRDNKPLADF